MKMLCDDFLLRTARYSGAAALLLVSATMAAGRDEGAPPRAGTGRPLYRSVTRYPVAVAPVVEDLATAARRDRETHRSRPPTMTSQRCPEIDEPARSASKFISPATRSSQRRAPLFLATPSPLPDLQFDTNPSTGLNRPDSAIAAGPSDLVTAVNFAFQVQDLDGGNVVSTGANSFFPNDPTNSVGDPRLSYDQATGRFIMSWLGFDYPGANEPPTAGDSYCDVAVSATSDPRGAWNKYTFQVLRNGTEQMDFDSLGYDGKAIYVTARMRDFANGTQFSGNRILILDKAKALAGEALAPLIVDDLQLPGGGFAEIIKPVESAELVTPTSPAYFLCAEGNNAVALYTLTDPLGSPSFASVSIPIPAWAPAGLAPQPDGPPALGQEAGFPLHKTTIRDGVIWSCQSPSATGIANERSGVVVYKIDAAGGTLLESHAISDPSIWYYLPAVVPDLSGNAAVVFAGSDATHYASIYYARYVAALGDFEAPVLVAAGTTNFNAMQDPGPQPQAEEAWGDYLDAAPDVASGNREIWLHGELPATATTWKMRAARVPTTPRPIIGVNKTSFQYGTVCVGETKDLTLTVSNSGTADLHVASILLISGSAEFALAGGPALPTTIAPGGHADYTIRFAPSLPTGSRTATFRISSDDPLTPTVDVAASGTVAAPAISAPAYLAFPPTVIQSAGACFTELPLPIQATGSCNLTIDAVSITGADASEFTLVGLPPGGFPVTLTPGQNLGSALAVQFRPTTVRRVHQAQVVVTYVTDPSTSATGTVSIPLYGEGVDTGARVLVTLNGVPVSEVEKLHLQLADPSRNGGNEVTHDLPLATVVGPVPELTFQYHREWGGASNPAGLAPDDYKITVTIRVGNKRQTQTVFFSVKPCGFESNVIVSFF
jgi:hypothetical protein